MQKYQVLARKYRPQKFSDVVGQEVIVTTLKNALRLEKIAHAYLFCGGRGTGKTTLARLFAKALNCLNLQENQEPCNECASCTEIMAGQSMDVIEIDGASNRGIDDIRQINEMVGYVPSDGRYKIYIIDEVHMLTKEAFNALLKTLEEPPPQAKFFFATTEPHKILPTVISRCQRFDLGRIATAQIVSKLEEIGKDLKREIDPEALHKIAALSEGSLRDAESLFDQILCFLEGKITADTVSQVFGLVSEEHFFALDTAFSEMRLAFAFELVSSLFHAGKDLSHFMSQLIHHYRLIAISKTLGEQDIQGPLAARYMQSSRLYTQQQSLYLLEYLVTAESNLQKSLSPRIFLENTLLHIIRSKNRIPIEVLVRRLSELESMHGGPLRSLEALPAIAQMPEEIKSPIPIPAAKIPEKPTPPQDITPPAKTPGKQTPPQDITLATKGPDKQTPPQDIPPPAKGPDKPPLSQKAKPPELTPEKAENNSSPASLKHQSHYDTLMRFAAVELEGSLK